MSSAVNCYYCGCTEPYSSRLDGVWCSDCKRNGLPRRPQVCTSRPGSQELHVNG